MFKLNQEDIPTFLVEAYSRGKRTESISDFTHFSYVLYRMSVAHGETPLSLHAWLKSFPLPTKGERHE